MGGMMATQDSLERELIISEVFGPTLQGEGKSIGKPAMFVRLGLCNLDCSWCDTPFTWDWTGKNGIKYDKKKELSHHSVASVIEQLDTYRHCRRLVISGGEPLVQSKGVSSLAIAYTATGGVVEVETNGTMKPPAEIADIVQWNVSPKLESSGVDLSKRRSIEALQAFARTADHSFKFVISDLDSDITEVVGLCKQAGIDYDNVYLMPEGRTAGEVNSKLQALFEVASQLGMNVTTRLHVLAFGDRRGV